MNRKQWSVSGSLLLFGTLAALSVPALGREQNKDKQDQPAPLSAMVQKDIEKAMGEPKEFSITLTYQSFKGSPSEIGQFLRKFMAEFLAQDLGNDLTDQKDPKPWAILHSDPGKAKEITIEIGYEVKGEPKVKAPLAVRKVTMKQAVRYTYSGDPVGLTQVYAHMVSVAKEGKKPSFPVAMHMLTNPGKVTEAAQIKTEIVVPLE